MWFFIGIAVVVTILFCDLWHNRKSKGGKFGDVDWY